MNNKFKPCPLCSGKGSIRGKYGVETVCHICHGSSKRDRKNWLSYQKGKIE